MEVIQNFSNIITAKFHSTLSICLVILGKRGSGKTDIALLITETLYNEGVIDNFATNIKILESSFHIDQINNLRSLEFWCKDTVGRKLFIFDEMGKSIRRRMPMSSINIQMIDNLQILRKYKLSLIIIAPAEKYVDSAVLGSDILDARIIKPNNKNPKVGIYEDLDDNEEIMFTDIPRTSIKFDTFDTAVFTKESTQNKTPFKEEDKNILWDWAHGAKAEDLGLARMQLKRKVNKFIIEVLEKERNT